MKTQGDLAVPPLPFALQAVSGGESRLTQIQVLFSIQYLRQIKMDLEKFSDDPDRYINVFQGLTQIFILARKM